MICKILWKLATVLLLFRSHPLAVGLGAVLQMYQMDMGGRVGEDYVIIFQFQEIKNK